MDSLGIVARVWGRIREKEETASNAIVTNARFLRNCNLLLRGECDGGVGQLLGGYQLLRPRLQGERDSNCDRGVGELSTGEELILASQEEGKDNKGEHY